MIFFSNKTKLRSNVSLDELHLMITCAEEHCDFRKEKYLIFFISIKLIGKSNFQTKELYLGSARVHVHTATGNESCLCKLGCSVPWAGRGCEHEQELCTFPDIPASSASKERPPRWISAGYRQLESAVTSSGVDSGRAIVTK